jgi:hypothetical protein
MSIDVEKLLSRIDLNDLAEKAGSHLHRTGGESRGNCPLHGGDNRTAFAVWNGDGRQHWRCWTACNSGGDALDFWMRYKRQDFQAAVRDLAAIAGLTLDEIGLRLEDAQAEAERRLRSDVIDQAAAFYAAQLRRTRAGQAGRQYLRSRGFTRRTIRQAGLGFSRSDTALAAHLKATGCDLELARAIGLIRADGRDFTANANGSEAGPHGWLIYVHRHGDRATYLSSRAVEVPGQARPKPEDKSRNLPGPRQLYWSLVRGCNSLIICEGPADAEALRQIGQSAVALCGLSRPDADDLSRIKRHEPLYIAVDSDAAAQTKLAAVEGNLVEFCHALGPLARVVALPDKDFADWQRRQTLTPDSLTQTLNSAVSWIEYRLRLAELNGNPHEIDARMCEIGALLAALPAATQLVYARKAALALKVGLPEIRRLISQAQLNGSSQDHRLSEIRHGRLMFLGETLCNFAPAITHELILDDGENSPICHYTVTGKLDNGAPLEAVEVAAEEFAGMNWVSRHWGARAIIHLPRGRYNVLSRAIQEISLDELKRERVYQFTGWESIDGQRSYLSANGALTAEGLNPDVRVDLGGNNLRHYALPDPGAELAAAIAASMAFLNLADRRVTAPIWAAMYAAPLTNVRSLNALMWVYGPTQSGKSTITHLALSHYGAGFTSGREYHAPLDWTSTVTAIEGGMFRVKDAPLVIDDFAPQFTSKAESLSMHKKAAFVARSIGNRSSRGRARADLSEQVTRVPRGLVIATAENPLIGQSLVGRMLYVNVEHGQIMQRNGSGALDQSQKAAQAGAYAMAMSAYLRWLAANWQRATELYQTLVEDGARTARVNSQLQNRLPDYYAVLDAAQQIALRAYYELGYISAYDMDRYGLENSEALLQVVAGQAEKIALESPVRKFLEAISSLLTRGKLYLAPRTIQVEYIPPERAEHIGWFEPFDSGVVYIDPEICLTHAKEYWRGLDENLDILPDALTRQIAQVGLLKERGQDSRLKTSKWIHGKTRWVLALDNARARELYGVDLSNETKSSTEEQEDIPL